MAYSKKAETMYKEEYTPKETVKDVLAYPIIGSEERHISKEVMEVFGVRTALSEQDGKTPIAHYFPSYDQKDEIVGYTKIDLTIPKDLAGHYKAIGSVKIGNKLFGQTQAEKIPRKREHRNVTITEGQWDCLSVYQSVLDSNKGSKFENLLPIVVSIPMGTKNAVESILKNEDFIQKNSSITIFFDNDKCTGQELSKGIMRGHEAREAVASSLLGTGIKIYTIEAKKGLKDASDYLQHGLTAELANEVKFNKKEYSSEKVVKGADISDDEVCEPIPEGFMVKSFPLLSQKLKGIRLRELTIVTAPSGAGKTTGISAISSELAWSGLKIGNIYLEETKKETMQRFIAWELKVNYQAFKLNPQKWATKEQIIEAKRKVENSLVFLDHFGSLHTEVLMNKIRHMYFVEGCSYIVLDHITMVLSGNTTSNERKDIDIVMTELAAFCAVNDVHIFVISHINRSGAEGFKPPKGKEDQPFWVKVTKEMLRGSASLEQCSWNILGLEPQVMPDRSRGNVRWVVLKNRNGSLLGVADEFKIDSQTGRTILIEDSDQPVDF